MSDIQTPAMWANAVNPVLSGFYPDPSVCRVDGDDGTWYYLVNSTFEYLPGLPVHRSRNLVDWEPVGHILDRPDQVDLTRVGDSGGMFAPTIRHDGTRFLAVCTLIGGAPGRSGNFIVTADDAAGPWSDPVWWDVDGIDPSILVDDDGRLWAHGTRLAPEPEWDQQTQVWVREVDRISLEPGDAEHIVWTGAVRGAVWAEGPHLYRRDGVVYLLAAEGGTGFNHAISVARADSPIGPFVGNPANPVLTHRQLGRRSPVINVGHADLVDAPDGTSWAVCLASRLWNGSDLLGRETFLVDVEWENGWPVFAPGEGRLSPTPRHPAPVAGPGEGVEAPTGYRADDLSTSIAVRRHPSEIGVEDLGGGAFSLHAGDGLTAPLPAYIAKRITLVDARVQVLLSAAEPGVRAGLALRYSSAAFVMMTVGDRIARVEIVAPDIMNESHDFDVSSNNGMLAFEIDETRATAIWNPTGGVAATLSHIDISHLCAEVMDGFVGATYGAVAIGSTGGAIFADLAEVAGSSA